jgi:hypothetical protein
MTPNMGTLDRTLRLVVAAVIAVLYLTGRIGGTLALFLGVVAVAFVVTSFVSWCPAYLPFGLSTRGKSGDI